MTLTGLLFVQDCNGDGGYWLGEVEACVGGDTYLIRYDCPASDPEPPPLVPYELVSLQQMTQGECGLGWRFFSTAAERQQWLDWLLNLVPAPPPKVVPISSKRSH